MPRTARQILRSNDGASIIMALFLFLVCAALSAVILTAATAASGRVAGLAAADQRYYNTTSAAGVFREMMGGDHGVSVQFTCTKTTPVESKNGVSTISENDVQYSYKLEGGSGESSNSIAQRALSLLTPSNFANGGANPEDVWNWELNSSATGTSGSIGTYTLDHGSMSDVAGVLDSDNLAIDLSLKNNGNIVALFKGTGESGRDNADYEVELECVANPSVTTEIATISGNAPTAFNRVETKVTKITWVPGDLTQPGALATGSGNPSAGGA